ncbi:MAG: prepilin peptidase [Gammaproteobacteria bacterium]|nr:prepilin peptidase [Gammaproteobacteria bacterium]MYJ51681.1 prepilin peptidase [Gammaproteobacteria bacterium]
MDSLPISLSLGALFVFGSIIGSFLNVVICRLPPRLIQSWRVESWEQLGELEKAAQEEARQAPGIIWMRSRCSQCLRPLKWRHAIPILSHLRPRGRCGICRARIPVRYLQVESITAALWVSSGYVLGIGMELLLALIFVNCLIVLAFIDIDHRFLPDQMVGPLLFIGLGINTQEVFAPLTSSVWDAIAGYLGLRMIREIHCRFAGGEEGLGLGDCKLLAAIGAWIGWESLPAAVATAAMASILYCCAKMIIFRAVSSRRIAFGPWLAGSGLCLLLWEHSPFPLALF